MLSHGIEFGALYKAGGGEAHHPRHICESPSGGPPVVAYVELATGKWYYTAPEDFLKQMKHGAEPTAPTEG